MKQTVLSAFIGFIATAFPASATHYQVYLLGGQSNGNGRADAAQLTPPLSNPQTDVRFYWHRTQSVNNVGHLAENQWIDLAPGSGHGTGAPVYAKEFGSEVSFGRAMAEAKPAQNIAIIKYTHGGSNLYSNWATGGSRYTSFVSTVQAGLAALTTDGHTFELGGMLWQQGESDTGGTNADNYETNLTNLISRVRDDVFNGGALPFVIGSLSDSQYGNITTAGSGPFKVRQAQETVAAADPAVGIVITDGYDTRIGDSIHLNHDAQVALGQNFATQILSLEGPDMIAPTILTTTPADDSTGITVSGNLIATFNERIRLVDGGLLTLANLGPGSDLVILLPDSRVTVSDRSLIINPGIDLAFENSYAVRISSNAISDLADPANAFDGIPDDSTWNFTTGSTEPVVTSLNPPDNASSVATNENLVITFDEPVQKGSGGNIIINESNGTLFESIPVTDARVSVTGAMITINPAGTFSPGSAYFIQITDGAIEDLEGNPWTGISSTDSTTWNFSTFLPANSIGTTGIFDEESNATNQLDVEVFNGTLPPFKAAVLQAYNNDLGGVVDWETGVTATASGGTSPNNTVSGNLGVIHGSSADQVLGITFDRSMDLYTNGINNQVAVLSQQGAFRNALIPSGGNAAVGLAYTMTFTGSSVSELGAAIPSRSTYSTAGVDFRATAIFSSGGSQIVDFTMSGTIGTGDTFLYFAAPDGESITSLGVAYLDDNGQGLTNGQRRPILDDLGFVLTSAENSYSNWISHPDFGLTPSEQGLNDDPDGDQLANGIEAWFGTDPGESNAGLADLTTDGTTTTFTHPQSAMPLINLIANYQWSLNLNDWHLGDGVDGPQGGPTVSITGETSDSITTVSALASEPIENLFFRVVVEIE